MAESTRTLSEPDSKAVLAAYGVPFAPEHRVPDPPAAVAAKPVSS